MMGKSIETAQPSSWELINSRTTAAEPVWDQTKSSACGRQLCRLVYLNARYQWDQNKQTRTWCMNYLSGACFL